MRITRSLLMTALFALVLGTASANTNPDLKKATNEIKTLIQKSNYTIDINNDVTVNVNFMVNAKNEIIILSTDQENLDATLKGILNYKKLKSSDLKINTTYTLPIVIKK